MGGAYYVGVSSETLLVSASPQHVAKAKDVGTTDSLPEGSVSQASRGILAALTDAGPFFWRYTRAMRPQHCNDCKKSLTFTAEQRAEIEKARKNGQYVMVLCEDCKRILAVKSVLGMALGR